MTFVLSRGYSEAAFVALLLVCLGLIVYFYVNNARSLPRWYFAILLAMRVLIVVVLLLFIFQPELIFQRLFTSAPRLLVLVDTSGSMGHSDPTTGERLELAKRNLRGKFLSKLEEQFAVSLYKFGGVCQPISYGQMRALRAEDELTDIAGACKASVDDAKQRRGRVAGIILLSDGIDNSGRRVVEEVAPLGIPVYPAAFGSRLEEDKDFKNVAIVGVEHDEFVAKDNTTEIKVLVDSQGYGVRPVQVLFKDKEKDKTLVSSELVLDTKKGAQRVVLKYTPTEIGRIDGVIEIPKLEDENRLGDNRKPITLNVTGPRIKVLYIEGVLREEGKWLMRNLQTDPNVELLYLVRSKEGQFLQRGNIKGITLTNIPTSLETWKRFDVFILGDVHSSLFTRNQMLDLEEAVAKDGRGLLLLGGMAALGPGKYAGTPIEKLSPARLESATIGQENGEFSWELTDDGQVHPIFANVTQFFPARGGVAEIPMQKLAGCTRVGAAQPVVATVLAAHPTAKGADGKPLIVVAVATAGNGRSMLVTADTTHRWYLPNRGLGRENPYVKFWGQAVRWLASEEVKRDDKPGLSAYTDKGEYEPGEKVRLMATVRDPQGQATSDAVVFVSIIGPSKERTKIDLPKVDGRMGEHRGTFDPKPGPHEAIFEARLGDQALGKPQTVKFTVGKPDVEMAELSLNEKLLKELADRTGGTYCSWLGLTDLANGLAADQERRAEPVKFPLHHAPTFFLFFVAMAAVEWYMRKRIQLA